MPKPLVSVVIPCFNAEAYLRETVESVFKQSFQDFEVIIVDDGSTDGSVEVIKSFGTKVKAELSSHGGASVTRNRGTQLARGEFIQYLDADDLLRPTALEKRIQALQSTQADVAYSDWQELQEINSGRYELSKIHSRSIEEVHANIEIALFTEFWAPPAALLYRKSIVDRIGGWNEALPVIQDARFLLDAGLHGGKFVHVSSVDADYRVHLKDSLSRRDPLRFTKDIFTNTKQVHEVWEKRGELTADQKKTLISNYEHAARSLFELQSADFDSAVNCLRQLEQQKRFCYPYLASFLKSFMGFKLALPVMSACHGLHRRMKF